MAQLAHGEGNTKLPRVRHRRWCFTWNNPEWEDGTLENKLKEHGAQRFIFQKEEGEAKTPHFQGYIEFQHPRDLNNLKNIHPNIHWEQTRGCLEDNVRYCSKVEGRLSEPRTLMITLPKPVVWRPWQQRVIEWLNQPPNDRKVLWVWGNKGNDGKTFLARHLYSRGDTCYATGKSADVLYCLANRIASGAVTKQVILDYPRSMEEYVSYQVIEQIKNGLAFSPKYESQTILLDPIPHVVVFANFPPIREKLSEDRWDIIELNA